MPRSWRDRPPLGATIRAYANAADHVLRSKYHNWETPVPGLGRSSNRVSETRFEQVLADHADDVVFVHAGLGAIKRAFDRNPYTYLRDVLDDHFESVLVPGFTPSFRESGIYHKTYSRPEYGAFARQFLGDAEYRTDDAIHSILVRGPYRFEGCDHRDSFGPEGCWAKLDEDDVLYCNVGTPWIISTQHHYLEHVLDVPYNVPTTYDGVIYYDESTHERCEQRNYRYTVRAHRSARKIQRRLEEAGALTHYELDGLNINFFRAREMRETLAPYIESDPYYLIT